MNWFQIKTSKRISGIGVAAILTGLAIVMVCFAIGYSKTRHYSTVS